ncbi:MAG: hypothetical protein R2746_03430 [Acidimicrobiales bacterium]
MLDPAGLNRHSTVGVGSPVPAVARTISSPSAAPIDAGGADVIVGTIPTRTRTAVEVATPKSFVARTRIRLACASEVSVWVKVAPVAPGMSWYVTPKFVDRCQLSAGAGWPASTTAVSVRSEPSGPSMDPVIETLGAWATLNRAASLVTGGIGPLRSTTR